jgi:preprotein translocase subunit SecE
MAGVKQYIEESWNELINKVTWPTWKELQSSGIVVAVASVIISLVVFLMDYVMGVNHSQSFHGILGMFYDLVVQK